MSRRKVVTEVVHRGGRPLTRECTTFNAGGGGAGVHRRILCAATVQ